MSKQHNSNNTNAPFLHPELSRGEVFFSNADAEGFGTMKFQTKRMGSRAYDGKGNPLSPVNWFPVFLQAEELSRQNTSLPDCRKRFRRERSKRQQPMLGK
jgi:hypothetical protein